ncbi:MAG: ABC transporter permease [Thermoanaerobaculia bacterium]
MADLVHDIRFAFRLLGKNPVLTAIMVASLAIGIGAAAAVFSLADALLLQPLPAVHAPAELVSLFGVDSHSPGRLKSLSWGDYLDYAGRTDVLSGLAAMAECDVSLTSGGFAERVSGLAVSPSYFSVLGLRPAEGRLLSAGDEAEPVVILGFGLWHRRFGANPKVIGSPIVLNGKSVTVVGVAPDGFWGTDLGGRREIWLPLRSYSRIAKGIFVPFTGKQDRKQQWLHAIGRLVPGITLARAQSVLNTVAKNLAATYPESNAGRGARAVPLTEAALGEGMRPLLVGFTARLMAAVALVLVVVVVNVAGLLLARGLARRREIAVRLSLGASRWRLVQQLFVEGLVLGLLGMVAGIGLAKLCLPLLGHLELPRNLAVHDLAISGPVLAFAVLASLVSALAFSLLPAIQTVRATLAPTLRGGKTRGILLSLGLRELLAGLQVALALLIMIVSGLALRTLSNLRSIDPGFDPAHVLVFSIDLSSAGYEGPRVALFYQDLLERLRQVPGVRAASMVAALPVMGADLRVDLSVSPEDGPFSAVKDDSLPAVLHVLVGGHFFDTAGLKILQGGDFRSDGGAADSGAVILNETAARLLWPGQNSLGKRLRLAQSETPFSVVGVAADSAYSTLKEKAVPVLYLDHSQSQKSFIGSLLALDMTLFVRTSGEPRLVLGAVRKTVRSMDPLLPVFHVSTLEELLASTIGVERQAAALYGSLALVAIALALLGLYGVVSHAVTERTREIGVRMACGATPGEVRRLVVNRSALLAVVGVVAGLTLAVPASRIVQSQLYGVKTDDPITWLVTPLILFAAAVWVSTVPARRAARIDPVVALRNE